MRLPTERRPLEISSLTKSYPTAGGRHVAIQDFRAVVQPGEFVALVGPPECGKSTLLSILAGHETASEGGVIIDGFEVEGPSPDRALLHSEPSLLPWLSALENVAPEPGRRDLARGYLAGAGASWAADQKPGQLSPAVQHRVALARAFSSGPRFLFLDDPFRDLSPGDRRELQDALLYLHKAHPMTIILATRDMEEAVRLSDRILPMKLCEQYLVAVPNR